MGANPSQIFSSDLLSFALLISEKLHIRGRLVLPICMIMWQGHPDITNEVKKHIKVIQIYLSRVIEPGLLIYSYWIFLSLLSQVRWS